MDTSGQNHLEGLIVALLIYVNQVIGVNLPITASPGSPLESTAASLTCHIPSFTGGAEWIKKGSTLTLCLSGSCIPPISARYQYSTNATSITVTIRSLDIAQDEGTWTCAHNGGTDTGVYNLTVYKIPSILSINGTNSSTLSDSVTVHLSVSTGCIHPSGPEHYNITWKYVEADSTAEKLFETGTTQNVTSVGGCLNAYENSLMLNLYLTNRMNKGTTTLHINQIKMTFTMAGRNVSALLNVTYGVTPVATGIPLPDATSKPDGAVFIIFDISIIILYTIMVILIIDLTISYKTSTISNFMACLKTGHRCLCILYIVLVIVVVVCEIVIIMMIIIGHQCQNIPIVGLVLGLIIMVITIIFVIVFIKTGVVICNKDTVRNPRTSTDVKITASLHPMFFSEIEWIGPKGNPLSTDGKYIIDQYNINTGETSLTITNVSHDDNGQYICQSKNGFKITKDSIHIMCADTEKRTKNAGPPVIHIGTQNKTEPKTTSKQTNERPQPLPPVGGVAEDKLKPHPQPPRPENIDAKDQNLRGLSANYDDTQGLASGTPRPVRLTPLILNQETVQEEDASEEKRKKKGKKKKKKSQRNEENQAEEMEELKSQRTSSED